MTIGGNSQELVTCVGKVEIKAGKGRMITALKKKCVLWILVEIFDFGIRMEDFIVILNDLKTNMKPAVTTTQQ